MALPAPASTDMVMLAGSTATAGQVWVADEADSHGGAGAPGQKGARVAVWVPAEASAPPTLGDLQDADTHGNDLPAKTGEFATPQAEAERQHVQRVEPSVLGDFEHAASALQAAPRSPS